uniref:non-specific serine/threonine protein kinase n=1 Tax=Fagus sylvatica TaxID=28930 RepID=A0A2N9HTA9_FAGSY
MVGNGLQIPKYINANNSITMTAESQDTSLDSKIPYMTTRIFTSEATYKFLVKADKRYWLRLYFYPAVYGKFNSRDSYFSVIANGLTLLKNFSASITCQALSQSYIVREYSLAPLNLKTLAVIFKPSAGSFAFVNGIEVIQIPDLFDSAKMVGSSEQIDVSSYHSQTMYRLNVGGQIIFPKNDSGLTRTWYDDDPYIFGSQIGTTNEASPNVKIQYQGVPKYVAPVDVYRSSRSMGTNKRLTVGFNLTYAFQVDPNSTYLLRFHFCDFYYSKPNQLVFSIFVNNQTAEPTADVIAWSGGKGIPTYQDYMIYFSDVSGDQKLWVALHPSTASKPEFLDPSAMLLEAEKVEAENVVQSFSKKSKTSHVKVIGGAAGGVAAFSIVAALCVVVYQRKKRVYGTESQTSSWLPIYGNSHTSGNKSTISGKSTASSNISSAAQGLCRHFSLAEITKATRTFDESNVIGVGGFGKTEVEMLSKLRHKHLVSLIGFCDEGNEMCLVYDYMARGTMREHLYKTKQPLSWKQRLEICIGAARGLHYLHTGARYTIIHRDVKTTNILLDENWVAKVSDFGLSKTGPNMNNGHVTTVVKGSFGYLDPEYFRRQQLTEKSDVYSFGVVLFEVLCARPALNPSLPKEQVSLADWALHCKRKGVLDDIIDSNIKGKIHPECLKKFAATAEKCLAEVGQERPSMGDVLWNLEFALQLQENDANSSHSSRPEESSTSDSLNNHNMAMHRNNLSTGSENEASDTDTSPIFSQIVEPKGR